MPRGRGYDLSGPRWPCETWLAFGNCHVAPHVTTISRTTYWRHMLLIAIYIKTTFVPSQCFSIIMQLSIAIGIPSCHVVQTAQKQDTTPDMLLVCSWCWLPWPWPWWTDNHNVSSPFIFVCMACNMQTVPLRHAWKVDDNKPGFSNVCDQNFSIRPFYLLSGVIAMANLSEVFRMIHSHDIGNALTRICTLAWQDSTQPSCSNMGE